MARHDDWDGTAADFQRVFLKGQNEYNDRLIAFWFGEGLLHRGDRVLDIGCGVGKYGVRLAALGCDVTLTDISSAMLRHAEENMRPYPGQWRTWCCDFAEATGEEPVFAPGFDFTLSTMSPAVRTAAAVEKMSRMTRGFCFLSQFCSWKQPLRDELLRRVGLPPRSLHERPEEANAALLSELAKAGVHPQTRDEPYDWEDLRSPREVAEVMIRFYELDPALAPTLEKAAAELAGEDGLVGDAVYTTVRWYWWKTKA